MRPFLLMCGAWATSTPSDHCRSWGADKTGFSPLAKKLRLTAGQRVAVLNAPEGYMALLYPGPSEMRTDLESNQTYNSVVVFVKDQEELRRIGPAAVRAARPEGLLWVVYPKGGETVGATDLPATPWWVQRDVLGEFTSQRGYKAVAFVAVDETWTALRFKKV